MLVSDLMTSPVVTIGLDDALGDVREIFEQAHLRHVLVVDEGLLVGVISERDVLIRLSPYVNSNMYTTRDLATLNMRVHQAVTRHPKSLHRNAQAYEAVRMFQSHRIGCIPVLDDEGAPVGIVTRGDLIRHFEAICATLCACVPSGRGVR